MHILLTNVSGAEWTFEPLIQGRYPGTLLSYAYSNCLARYERVWTGLLAQSIKPRIMLDSGAFTAFTGGKRIKLREYSKWVQGVLNRWAMHTDLHYMNLDVIGDQDATWRNQRILEALGINPLPIVTYGAEGHHLERVLKYPYFALGGLVPYAAKREALRQWLDYCFAQILQQWRATGVMPRVHLLGITSDWVLQRYPCYTCDSSAWVYGIRYGKATAAGIPRLPRSNQLTAAQGANIHALVAEVKKYSLMQRNATQLWANRGIVFDCQKT